MESHFQNLIRTYHELNSERIDVLDSEPSPIQFMRYVAKNRPFLVKAGCSAWPAVRKWNEAYLTQKMGDRTVNVAITPHGNADAPVVDASGNLVFAEPFEDIVPFSSFMRRLAHHNKADKQSDLVWYSQAQNDNLRGEYSALFADVKPNIDWADLALGPENALDAVNIWIGTGRSVTSLHRDNYENVYCQILGQKHFVLLPPIAAQCVNEQWLSRYVYQQDMNLRLVRDGCKIPVAIWDPDQPEKNATSSSSFCKPMRATLEPGITRSANRLLKKASHAALITVGGADESRDDDIDQSLGYDQHYDGTMPAALDFIRSMAWNETAKHSTAKTS